MRLLLSSWMVQSPDVHLVLCPFFTGATSSDEANRVTVDALNIAARRDHPPAMLVFHYAAGMAAHLVERPQADPSSAEVQVAGVEAMLRVHRLSRQRGLVEPYAKLEELASRDPRGAPRVAPRERGLRTRQSAA